MKTRLARIILHERSERARRASTFPMTTQVKVLRSLLNRAKSTKAGRRYNFASMISLDDVALLHDFRSRVPAVEYEDIRRDVMRMVMGEKDVLWRGVCRNFAQSSGTSGGKSKYIPITHDSLYRCHYSGASASVAFYLDSNRKSRLFSGKAFILGGSFANTVGNLPAGVKVGDLSATLIDSINPIANLFRVPDKKTALLSDWTKKLPLLVEESSKSDVTNLSGVPSWFMTVLKEILQSTGKKSIREVWRNLEVFFHGGIGFDPYREEYQRIIGSPGILYFETYNASEGFFATQNQLDNDGLLLLLDNDVFFEFIPIGDYDAEPVFAWEVQTDKVYEMIITSSNGLWRYRIGDTVRIVGTDPLKIRIAGRTKTYINAFGEELMEENAEKAIEAVCRDLECAVDNYTAAPVFASRGRRGRHQWLIEWEIAPQNTAEFARKLDSALRELNSDYDAKRTGDIFLDLPEIISLPTGTFNDWLMTMGNGKLGGQRKIPRLCNDRHIADKILTMIRFESDR